MAKSHRQAASANLALMVIFLGCASEPPPPPEGTPRLILFVVVDQARYDYLERFRPLLTSGLGQLLDESVVFTNAHHDHAITNTAPGHATLATGVSPRSHGIINNWWLDRDQGERVAAVGWPPSPEKLLASTLGDWLKATYPSSKVFAAGGKDRSAIFTAGQDADGAYWMQSDDGRIVSSRYYHLSYPGWIDDYNDNRFLDRYFGQAWKPLPEVVEHGPAYGTEPLSRGTVERQFPHPIGPASPVPSAAFYSALVRYTPFGDAYLADFARALIEGEELGRDGYPDFLGLAFSALDKVGHSYGPDSPEVLDTFLRLDRALGEVLDFIDQHVGLEHTLVSLSSDHGVTPVPEALATKGVEARRFDVEEATCFQRIGRALEGRFGDGPWFIEDFYLDRERVAAAAIEPAEIENATRRLLEQCPGVERVWTRTELEHSEGAGGIQRLYARNYHSERSPDLMVQLEPHTLPEMRTIVTNHGTPYPYDTHVPWLLRLPSAIGGRIDAPVYTVDVAPTVARLAGIEPPAGLDGVDRGALLPRER